MSSLVSWLSPQRSRFGIAFSPRELHLAELAGGQVSSMKAVSLPEGALSPGSRDPNMGSVVEIAKHVDERLPARRERRGSALMLLPDLSVAAEVVDGPSAREQLLARCGLPEEDLRFDTWAPPQGGILASAARGAVVAQYESIRSALGYRPGWVDSVSSALLPERARRQEHQDVAPSAEITSFPEHYTLAAFASGRLVEFRRKLQCEDADEAFHGTASEITRLSRALDFGRFAFIGVSGWRAEELSERLRMATDASRVEVRAEDESTLLQEAMLALARRTR